MIAIKLCLNTVDIRFLQDLSLQLTKTPPTNPTSLNNGTLVFKLN